MTEQYPYSSDDGNRAGRRTLEHAALNLPQQRRLDELRESHPTGTITVGSGPGGTVEAAVTFAGPCSLVEYVFGRDADDMLAKVERAVAPSPP